MTNIDVNAIASCFDEEMCEKVIGSVEALEISNNELAYNSANHAFCATSG